MRQLAFVLALVGCSGVFAASAAADCVNNLAFAQVQIDKLLDERQKEMAERQLRLAKATRHGGTDTCLLFIGISVAQPTA